MKLGGLRHGGGWLRHWWRWLIGEYIHFQGSAIFPWNDFLWRGKTVLIVVANSTTFVAINIKPFIPEGNPDRFTIIPIEHEPWNQRLLDIDVDKDSEVAPEGLGCSTAILHLK
jgi:hypothetical protein